MKQSSNRHISRWITTCSSFSQCFFPRFPPRPPPPPSPPLQFLVCFVLFALCCLLCAVCFVLFVTIPQLEPCGSPKDGWEVELFPHTCTHRHTYKSSSASNSPHLYTPPYIQKHFPTPVHTAIHTKAVLPAFSLHLYTLSYIQNQCCQHFPTPAYTVIHTKAVLPACPHTCTHCHTYKSSVASVSPHLYTLSYVQKQCCDPLSKPEKSNLTTI